MPTGTPTTSLSAADVEYTTIDLNDTSTTSTVYDGDTQTVVYGVYMENGGSTAEVNLEVTDGSSTSVIAQPGAGNNLEFTGPIALNRNHDLQINVTTAEGSAQTNDAAVFRDEQ